MYTTRSAEAVSIDNSPEINPFSIKDPEASPQLTIISDAFEAVTNGMYNPEAMMKLQQLESSGNVDQWRAIIRAIEAFYKQDFKSMEEALAAIPESCLASSLSPVLYQMSGLQNIGRTVSFYEGKLIKKVTEDSRFLSSAAAQLNDSIEYSGDLFIETASLLVKEIRVNNPEAAERLVLWCFSVCLENNFDEEPLADNVLMIFGQAEGLRLIALSLMEEDPESALICFTRALIKRIIDKSIDREEAAGWLDIIDTLMSACRPSDPIFVDMSELLSMLESEMAIYFGLGENESFSSNPLEKISSMKNKLSLEKKQQPPAARREQVIQPSPAKTCEAVQLELF